MLTVAYMIKNLNSCWFACCVDFMTLNGIYISAGRSCRAFWLCFVCDEFRVKKKRGLNQDIVSTKGHSC